MRTIIILLSLLVVGLLTSCQQKKNKAALTDQKVEIAKPSSEKTVETISELEKTEKSVKQMNYYVVAGCFEFKENAERLNQLLISKGFKSQYFAQDTFFFNLSRLEYFKTFLHLVPMQFQLPTKKNKVSKTFKFSSL